MPNRTPIRLRDGEFVSTGQRAHETLTALPTMLCAARTQVVAPHWLLGLPELSKLQAPFHLQKKPQRVLGYNFMNGRRGGNPKAASGA